MQFSTKLFVSLVLPAAITILVSFLWLKKKSQEAEELQQHGNTERDDVKDEEEKENNVDELTATESEICQASEDNVDAEPYGVQRFSLQKQSSTTESTQQDSSGDTKPSVNSERKESSGGEESLSEGSVDSSTLYTEGFSNDTPPPPGDENNGNKSRKGVQNDEKDVWEIEFPQILCGRLIGRKGKNVRVISEKSGAKIRLIPQSPGEVSTHRIISISGSSLQIQTALDSIHEKFPCVPLTRLNSTALNGLQTNVVSMQPLVATGVPPAPQAMPFVQAMLPSVANFDVVVTSVADAGHFFVQLHNEFMQRQLQDLHQTMMQCYGQGTAPLVLPLPHPIVVGSCCAAPAYTYNGWYRAQVLGPTANPDEVEVKYLDYGGYGRIAASSLRQLRADFLTLPFQAIECYLANVIPLQGDTFSNIANAVLEDMTMNAVLTCRVTGHRNGLPCLELYLVQGQQVCDITSNVDPTGALTRYMPSFFKQLLDEVEHDIMNYQNRGLCYLPKPKAEADNTDTRF